MDTVLKMLSDPRIVIAIAVVVVILIVYFIVRKMRAGSYRKQLEKLEVRYNKIKTVPLSFKLNKAVAISRVDQNAMAKVATTKDDFDKAEANLRQISQALADADDEIIAGKLKRAKSDLADLEASISLGESQVSKLDSFLDSILEKETAQRQEVNELKNRFRTLKSSAQENQNQLSYMWPTIQQNISNTEKMFSAFEEWMYANDFQKASDELQNIRTSMDDLEHMIHALPSLLDDARGVVPKMAEAVKNEYAAAKDKGVYLSHLQVEKNLQVITSGLKEDLEDVRKGQPADVSAHLDDYKTRLKQMHNAVKKEEGDFDALQALAKDTAALYQDVGKNLSYVNDAYSKANERFGLKNLDDQIKRSNDQYKNITDRMPKVFQAYKENNSPASSLLSGMKELNQDLSICSNGLKSIRSQIDTASGDEQRAKKQLIKLQVIMNQMQVKIRKYKLPSISQQYEDDMRRANEYISSLNKLINATPLNVQLLNSTLKEAIDFIYKLYNNVNNVVATVIMVENTIVFGNRYRSTYADIDSELTRSELCFRNGDYTQALTIAIATIEKIHPGNYENMIKENAKSAA